MLAIVVLALIFSGSGSRQDHLPDLAPAGFLPSLQTVMRDNAALRRRVQDLSEREAAYVFVQYKAVDREIASILLLWGGADLTVKPGQETGIAHRVGSTRSMDPRVAQVLRRIYGFGAGEPIAGHPLAGDTPWEDFFSHCRVRLLAQIAGDAVFDAPVLYDVARDSLSVQGRLSQDFFEGFTAFVQSQPNPRPYVMNLLTFVDDTKGLRNLSPDEKRMVRALYDLGGTM